MAEKSKRIKKDEAADAQISPDSDLDNPQKINLLNLSERQLPGFRIFHLHAQLEVPALVDLQLQTGHVTLLFVQSGELQLRQPDAEAAFEIGTWRHNAFYFPTAAPQIWTSQRAMQVVGLQIESTTYQQWAQEGPECLQQFAKSIADSSESILFPQPAFIDLPIQACLRDIALLMDAQSAALHLRAKAMEIVALQAACGERKPTNSIVKTDYDRDRLLFARDYLLQAIAAPPSLPALARISGINEFKLKRGFKELFGDTVFGYLANARLDMAKVELVEGRKSVTEIAFDLGYSSLQHFSTAFKKRFGVSPNQLPRT